MNLFPTHQLIQTTLETDSKDQKQQACKSGKVASRLQRASPVLTELSLLLVQTDMTSECTAQTWSACLHEDDYALDGMEMRGLHKILQN